MTHYHLLFNGDPKRDAGQSALTRDEAEYGRRCWKRSGIGRKLTIDIEEHADEQCPEYRELLAMLRKKGRRRA